MFQGYAIRVIMILIYGFHIVSTWWHYETVISTDAYISQMDGSDSCFSHYFIYDKPSYHQSSIVSWSNDTKLCLMRWVDNLQMIN